METEVNEADGSQYELEEVPNTEDPKQQLSDTYITFTPKNSTGYTTKGNVIEVQIPRTEHVIALARGYIYLDLQCGFKCPTDDFDPLDNDKKAYIGLINAATIFDQIRVNNNGKTIISDTFVQVNARRWQLEKSSHYLKSMPASFINIDDISMNEGFLVHELNDTDFTADTTVTKTFKLKIPLPCLFNCFDNVNAFSTAQLNDDVTLTMKLSSTNRYMCLIITDANGKVLSIEPFDTTNEAIYKYGARDADTGDIETFKIQIVERENTSDIYQINDNLRLVCPAHYPTPTEAGSLAGLVDNQGLDFPYITCDIQEQKANFGPCANLNLGKDANNQTPQWSGGTNQHLHFNTNTNNVFAVLMLTSHANSYCVYDKPYISNIECNLSELIKLANNKVHTGSTYIRDNDMYQDLKTAFGAEGFKNIERFDESIRHDYFVHDYEHQTDMLGSYMQYYAVACGQMLGVSADYFAHQINYKFKSEYEGNVVTANNDNTKTWLNTTKGFHNYANASVFCCQLTFKRLLFVNGGLDVECPLSENYDIRRQLRGEVSGNMHGVGLSTISAFSGPITNLLKSAGSALRNEIYRIKRNKNTTHAYTRLGKEGYEKHKAIIDENGTMGHRKFKKFIDNLIESEKQLSNNSNGLGSSDPNALGGTASKSIGQANQEIETEKGVDIRNLNLNVYHQQSRNADFADRVGWKYQLILDYKYGGNLAKLRLSSWGVETAILGVNNSHGLGTWIKEKWNKFKNWWREKGKDKLIDTGKQLLENAKDIAKSYAQKILSGDIKISDVPAKFLPTVKQIISNGDLTRNLDPKIQEAINVVRDIKEGKKTWQDVPSDIYHIIKEKNLEANNGNGLIVRPANGLIIRHGFAANINPKAHVPWSITKRRVQMLLDKNPATLKDKDLRAIYMFNRVKNGNGLIDRSGNLGITLRRLYGEPIYRRKLITENHHGFLKELTKNPDKYKKHMVDKYFGGDMSLYRDWKKTRKLPAHKDLAPVNSPFMQQVDSNHGLNNVSDAELEAAWKKNKKALKQKMKAKLKAKMASKK